MSTRVVHVNDNIEGAVYVGRAVPRAGIKTGSVFCNPFRIGPDGNRVTVLTRYCVWLLDSPGLLRLLPELRGKPLACWCRHDGETARAGNRCHADTLVYLLDRYTDEELRAMGDAA